MDIEVIEILENKINILIEKYKHLEIENKELKDKNSQLEELNSSLKIALDDKEKINNEIKDETKLKLEEISNRIDDILEN